MAARCLITGAQGFIGRYLTAHILREHPKAEVVGIGRSPRLDGFFTHRISRDGRQSLAPLPPNLATGVDHRFRYIQLSLLDTERLRALLDDLNPSLIFHLASPLSSGSEPQLLRSCIEGTASLMDAISGRGDRRSIVILASSGAVYGSSSPLPHSEGAPTDPADMYGVAKLACEHIVRLKAIQAGVGFVIGRIFNVVGPGQVEAHVCGRFAAQIASRRPDSAASMEVGNLHTTRDFIDVRDVATAFWLLARHGESGAIYNVASGRETAIREVLNLLLDAGGRANDVACRPGAERRLDVARHFADVSRLRAVGFTPQYGLVQSLKEVLDYYRSNPSLDRVAAAGSAADRV